MNRRALEMSVGVFVLIGLVCVGYLAVRLGRMELLGGDYYTVSARFSSVAGLKPGASVEVAGVPVGSVGAVDLHDEDQVAVVTLKIRSGVELTEDSIASIKTSGLIGDKYISILPGGAEETIEPGGNIDETESALDIEGLISKFAHGSVK